MKLTLPAKDQINEILQIDQEKLPSFPQAAAKLLEAAKNDTASLKDFSKILETDPGLSAQILKLVNSALYGQVRKITTVSDAVVLIGLEEIKKQALGVTMFNHLFKEGQTPAFDRLLFWRHCLAVAVLCEQIAKKTGYINPEEAYTAGLLHDVGKIFLDCGGRKDFGEFIHSLSTSTDLVIEHERRCFTLGHDDIGAYFCAQWDLPKKLIVAVKFHHQPFAHLDLSTENKALTAIVSLANFLCWLQGMGSFDFLRPPVLQPEVETILGLSQEDMMGCIQAMNNEIDDISAFYHFAFPSPEQIRGNLLQANLRLSRINTQYYYQENPLERIAGEDMTRDEALDLELEFAKPLARAKSVKEVLDILMYQIGRIFKPKHWSILLKEPKTEKLVFSVVVGESKQKLQGVKLPKGEGIAGYIMETGKPLVVGDVSKDRRFSKRVDTFTGFRTRSIIGTPLKTGEKIFGVIQLINRVEDGSFDKKDMTLLANIAEYAAIAIERSYYTQSLTNLATKDALTGLKNRWSFERALGNRTDFQTQYGNVFSMLIISLGGFAKLYHEKGQDACDGSIKAIAQMMNASKRRGDELFRYGELVFLMLLPITHSDGADVIKDRIEERVLKATKAQGLPDISISIVRHTLNPDDIGSLKERVAATFSKARETQAQDHVADFEDNLQHMVEKEIRKEEEALKDKKFGKAVFLMGHYLRPNTRTSISIQVHQISLAAIGFTVKTETLTPGDFLDIQFVLDDLKRSIIKRQIVVKEVQEGYVRADFYNPPPYAKNLGFYLMN